MNFITLRTLNYLAQSASDVVPIEEWASEFLLSYRLTKYLGKAQWKQALNGRFFIEATKDPKPGELTMSRLNADENRLTSDTD